MNKSHLENNSIFSYLDSAARDAGLQIIPLNDGRQIWVSPESKQKIIDYANAKEIPIEQAVQEIIDEQIFPL